MDRKKPELEWTPDIVAGRLKMKRRDEHGRWEYREPTPEEEFQFLSDNAW